MSTYLGTFLLIRGTSGSGKSTLAAAIADLSCWKQHGDVVICAADDYMMTDGAYHWSPEKLSMAHYDCQYAAELAMQNKAKMVIVHNTSCREADVKKWKAVADSGNYQFTSVVVENRHEGKNVHEVPAETVAKQAQTLRQSIKIG